MAQLGPVDLATLDTLITAGIAASRSEGARWALTRIREQPAYATLSERARELDELKAHFLTPADRRADALGVVTITRCAPEPITLASDKGDA